MAHKNALLMLIAAIAAGASALLFIVLLDQRNGPAIIIANDPAESETIVSIGGAVVNPGVYTLAGDARLNDAVAAAGGLTADADAGALNLAARISDEDKIEIPRIRSIAGTALHGSPVAAAGESPRSESASDGLININNADAATLETLPGIGPVLATRIVDYREKNGPFSRIEELARVDGVSATMVEELSDSITVSS